MSDTGPRTPFSGKTRAEDGLLVTFTDGERQRVVACSGDTASQCLIEALALAERWSGDWKVAVVSSPTTIYRDLQGSREVRAMRSGRRVASVGSRAEGFATPEQRMLGKIGRMDMLAS